jgi:ureidoglycolate dehydrogenase (NAD+)/L-2-hydroxycarboxylate dehydrogenase (NAD+)
MSDILRLRNITDNYAQFIIEDYIEAELEGHSNHGVAKLLLLDAALSKKTGEPKIIKQRGNYAQVDGNKDLGHIAGLFSVNLAIELANKNLNSIVSLTNASRYSRIKPFARMIAKAGYIGIIINNGGPAAVTPYGSITPVFGTNPICFSFPSNDSPYIFDFSTSKRVWGEIRQSLIEGRPLPADCFLDKEGNFTTDPNLADAVLPFGDTKGYALCYAIEILTGAFVGAKMGSMSADEYDLGFLFIVLSPEMFSSSKDFIFSVDQLANEVKKSEPLKDNQKVYIPGQRSEEVYNYNLSKGIISLDEQIFERLKLMSKSLDGGFDSNNKIN